jgi:hypothetical protein
MARRLSGEDAITRADAAIQAGKRVAIESLDGRRTIRSTMYSFEAREDGNETACGSPRHAIYWAKRLFASEAEVSYSEDDQ